MPYDDPIDDEDWYDENNDECPDESEAGHCPECGGPVYELAEGCPACGHWLSASDRRQIWGAQSSPAWIKVVAAVLLVALILSILAFVPIGF